MSAEYLAKAHFSKQGYLILTPDCHETNYDFVILKEGEHKTVQVKSVLEIESGFNLARIRNKHGQNRSYKREDYDILAGVWIAKNKIYLFRSEDINSAGFGETITIARLDGTKLFKRNRPIPYYEGEI